MSSILTFLLRELLKNTMGGAADYIRFGGRELHSALRKEFKEERQMNSASTF